MLLTPSHRTRGAQAWALRWEVGDRAVLCICEGLEEAPGSPLPPGRDLGDGLRRWEQGARCVNLARGCRLGESRLHSGLRQQASEGSCAFLLSC